MSELLSLDIEVGTAGTTVRVAGDIDVAAAPQLRECLAALDGNVTVDLSKVPFLDSTAINVFLGEHKRRSAAGATLTITGASANALRVFEVTGVDRLLNIDGDDHAAGGDPSGAAR